MSEVKQIPSVSFMTTGKPQVAAVYHITVDEIRDYVAQTASSMFGKNVKNDWVSMVVVKNDDTSVYNEEKRRNEFMFKVSCQIVIPKPFNLYDNGIEVPMIGLTFGEYSSNVTDFVRKFARLNDKHGKKLKDAIKEQHDRYIILLSMPAILDQMFDTSGFYYNKAFGKTDRPVSVEANFIAKDNCYNKNTGLYYFGNSRSADNTWCYADEFFEYVEVIKQYTSSSKAKKPMPLTRSKAITIH
jgi:hypothetical protein